MYLSTRDVDIQVYWRRMIYASKALHFCKGRNGPQSIRKTRAAERNRTREKLR